MKISLFCSIWISLPFIIYQCWIFISPGLYKNEVKFFFIFIIGCPALFFIGVAFSYLVVMPLAWSFFLSFETSILSDNLPLELEARVGEYFSLSLQLMLAFGLSFQLPVILLIFANTGVIDWRDLIRYRRYAFILILILSAFLTPPDVLSQIGLSIPLYCLYELSIILARKIKNSDRY
jgi:sec-independent protein translocase protein TatC